MNIPNHMVVSDPLAAFEKEGMLKVIAPAKTNLVLAVGDRRPDGYHNTSTIMHALNLHDVLHVDYYPESAGGLELEVSCHARENLEELEILSEENLATRAISLLAKKLNRTVDEKITIRIEKHIPLQAGLGGGSSDAAAALVAAAHLWEIEPQSEPVLETAVQLGSDVSFFLFGGCAFLTGTGEEFQHMLTPMKKSVALIMPDRGVSTAEAYRTFDESPVPIPEDVLSETIAAKDASEVPLFNNLSTAAETLLPELVRIRTWAQQQEGVEGVLLSGSGSATIVVCDSFNHAHYLVSGAKMQGWWARTTSFSALRAAIVPKR
ncbi:MAG: 4-(cytidine 5'-diphospho)-2-C-methyl-D-erythritol kinase [Raoultibacter sp.]